MSKRLTRFQKEVLAIIKANGRYRPAALMPYAQRRDVDLLVQNGHCKLVDGALVRQ